MARVDRRPPRRTAVAACALAAPLLAASLLAPAAARAAEAGTADANGPDVEVRGYWTGRSPSLLGPLAAANQRQPGIAPLAASSISSEAELRHTLRAKVADTPLSLGADLLAAHEEPAGSAPARNTLRANELYGSADLGAWQLSAGKKIVGWDVGYGFRPNDIVQQETRRTLLSLTPEGRPLLQLERFGSEDALSLVWVNPERWQRSADETRGAAESAFALRGYRRFGALDAFAFARHGAHTGNSLGAAFAWVATDELELHASARWLQRHDGWQLAPGAGDGLQRSNPWQQATRGAASQWLLGANWTGSSQQSLMIEYWHDGSALPDREWDRWRERNGVLAALPAAIPAQAVAGNLAWQAAPFNAQSVRQDNLFIRLAWQPEHWTLSLDALVTPADRGRAVTAALQWQGDRWRLNAAWRVNSGPADALLPQLPTRRSGLLAATRWF